MVKALISDIKSQDVYDLYFPDIQVYARFVYNQVDVKKPINILLFENIQNEIDVPNEIYEKVKLINFRTEQNASELQNLAQLMKGLNCPQT